ncbi:hypothetical protein PRIPAC_77691 [Pristionchus pacificus]|uniref:Uncharacterized protein n=1 Tax=Pristionchus pacificus TaxID=54126 RepID=A0A2A6BXA2_PRIPA|nr:hypothetical protein PRIPAC_77691 [Pristionchus pacificus]|eukprot:PDM70632.1 hypothetical protein PRIPAC_46878 [Pristionchus pacificus]
MPSVLLFCLLLSLSSSAIIPNRYDDQRCPVVKKAAADEEVEKDLSICQNRPILPYCSTGVTGYLWYYDVVRERCIYTGYHGCRGGQKNLFERRKSAMRTVEESYTDMTTVITSNTCVTVKRPTTIPPGEAKEAEAQAPTASDDASNRLSIYWPQYLFIRLHRGPEATSGYGSGEL